MALVLSEGGALGYAHIGVLKILEKYHIPIDYVIGTSFGLDGIIEEIHLSWNYSLSFGPVATERMML